MENITLAELAGMALDDMPVEDMTMLPELKVAVMKMRSDYKESLDTIWMLLAAILVFFMHAGFSMLEAGCVRQKNTQNILAKNFIVVTLGFICWYFFGYAFAFGATEDPDSFLGSTNWAMDGFDTSKASFRFWFFQGAFCATGGTIVSGAMAERTQLKGFATFVVLMTSWIYPVVVYWGWSGNGFLYNDDGSIVGSVSFSDFAGSGIVHLSGGIGALVGIIAVGARKGRWDEDKQDDFMAHSVPFCTLGTFFLWFGWYGFNPGSTGAMHDESTAYTASLVACNTTLAPCVAGLVVFMMRAKLVEPFCLDVGGFCNGILAGLVSITAGCSSVQPWESIVIGFIGAFVYQGCSMLLRKLKLDDVVDAVPVHGACGLWGILALGFFGDPDVGGNGAFYVGNLEQFGVQLFGGFMIFIWVFGWSALVFVPLRRFGMLRMGDELQDKGADVAEHSPKRLSQIMRDANGQDLKNEADAKPVQFGSDISENSAGETIEIEA